MLEISALADEEGLVLDGVVLAVCVVVVGVVAVGIVVVDVALEGAVLEVVADDVEEVALAVCDKTFG